MPPVAVEKRAGTDHPGCCTGEARSINDVICFMPNPPSRICAVGASFSVTMYYFQPWRLAKSNMPKQNLCQFVHVISDGRSGYARSADPRGSPRAPGRRCAGRCQPLSSVVPPAFSPAFPMPESLRRDPVPHFDAHGTIWQPHCGSGAGLRRLIL